MFQMLFQEPILNDAHGQKEKSIDRKLLHAGADRQVAAGVMKLARGAHQIFFATICADKIDFCPFFFFVHHHNTNASNAVAF